MQYRSWKAASFVIGHLPARAAYALAALIGVAGYYCWPRGRRAMLRNFRHVLPHAAPSEIRRVARASLVNYCRYLADFIQFHRFEINRRQFHDVPGERPGARPYFQQPFEPLFLQHGHDLADDILIPQEMLPQ